jgi:hypothetical protein
LAACRARDRSSGACCCEVPRTPQLRAVHGGELRPMEMESGAAHSQMEQHIASRAWRRAAARCSVCHTAAVRCSLLCRTRRPHRTRHVYTYVDTVGQYPRHSGPVSLGEPVRMPHVQLLQPSSPSAAARSLTVPRPPPPTRRRRAAGRPVKARRRTPRRRRRCPRRGPPPRPGRRSRPRRRSREALRRAGT